MSSTNSTNNNNAYCSNELLHAVDDLYPLRDASAPPLPPFSFDVLQGYELTTGWQSVCMLPPTNSPPYCLHSPYEPPPPYEEQQSIPNGEFSRNECAEVSITSIDRCCMSQNRHHINSDEWCQPHSRENNSQIENKKCLNEEDIVEALSKFVSSNCCYNSSITKHMKTKDIIPSNGHQYVLETFYEERSTSWQQEPYNNQVIDAPEDNAQPPPAWNIYVPKPKMFVQKDLHMEVPHTSSVKDCSSCHGKGKKPCCQCHGSGGMKCSACDGLGIQHQFNHDDMTSLESRSNHSKTRPCHHCNGGRRCCLQCSGNGLMTCSTCKGNGSVKVYIRLTVKWKVLKSHKVLERTRLPNKCIAESPGALIFHEQNDQVYPLLDFPEDEINNYSRQIITSHIDELQQARVIMQRHCVREVPVTEVRSQWKQQDFTFWVYGDENQVYCPDYPAKCFVGCSIL